VLLQHPQPLAAAVGLVAAANDHGGRDNTTVVVVDVLEGDDPPGDTVDLDLAPMWAEEQPDRLIDAEAGEPGNADFEIMPMSTLGAQPARSSRRGLGVMLFVVALGIIATLTVTLVLVVRHNANDAPTSTTTSSTSSTSTSSTSTTSTTSTTVAASSTSAGP
jgi:hypothetical protein